MKWPCPRLASVWPGVRHQVLAKFLGRSKWSDPAEGQLATQEDVNTPLYTQDSLQESRFHTCPGQAQLFLLHLGKRSPLEEPWLRVSWLSRSRGSVPTVLLPPKLNWSLDLECHTPGAFFKGTAGGSAAAGRPGQARPGQARPGGLGARRQMRVSGWVGWGQTLQEAVLCFSQRSLAT